MGFERGRPGFKRRFNPRHHTEGGPRFRKGSGQVREQRDGDRRARRLGGPAYDNDNQGGRPFHGKRMIRKRHDKPQKPKDKDDMDRQMRQYWVKSGSHKGKQEASKEANLASKKMNEEMDEYWKKAKEKKQQKVEAAVEKKAPQA